MQNVLSARISHFTQHYLNKLLATTRRTYIIPPRETLPENIATFYF